VEDVVDSVADLAAASVVVVVVAAVDVKSTSPTFVTSLLLISVFVESAELTLPPSSLILWGGRT